MAKNKNIVACLLCILLLSGVAWGESVNYCRECVVDHAYTQVGIRELTGNNDGKEVEAFLRYTNLGAGYPWCAAFVASVLHFCGIKNPASAYSPDWFKKNVVYKRDNSRLNDADKVLPSDVFGIYFPSKGRVAHVGLVVKQDGGYIVTIEGNTNDALSRDGDGVYCKRRLKSQIYVVSRWISSNADRI
jgi:hypothetical protein